MPIQIQEAHITSNRQDQKRKFPQHIIVKTLIYTKNVYWNLKEENKQTNKQYSQPIQILTDFSIEIWEPEEPGTMNCKW